MRTRGSQADGAARDPVIRYALEFPPAQTTPMPDEREPLTAYPLSSGTLRKATTYTWTFFVDDDGSREGVVLTASVCGNPDCPCTSVHLDGHGFAQAAPDAAKTPNDLALRLEFDVAANTLEGVPVPKRAAHAGLLGELDRALRKKSTRAKLRADFDRVRASVEPVSDPEYRFERHHDKTLAVYREVFPESLDLEFEYRDALYVAIDAWCVDPSCPCREGAIEVFAIDRGSEDDVAPTMKRVGGFFVEQEDRGPGDHRLDAAMKRAILDSSMRGTFEKRRDRLRKLAASRWGFVRPKPPTPPVPSAPRVSMRELTAAAGIGGVATGAKVGRNDRCPCGSGKKFKHCCAKRG